MRWWVLWVPNSRAIVIRNENTKRVNSSMKTAAYSTAQTLFMPRRCGVDGNHPALQVARDYLLKAQFSDDSWRVESRLKNKAQPFFENGDPHGEHEFVSTAATCWATAALAQMLSPKGMSGS